MASDRPKSGIASHMNFNTGAALGCILLGIAIWLLVPSQVAEPPRFFGRSSAGISPRLFPQIIAVGFVIIGALYAVASLRMRESSGFIGLPRSAYINVLVILAVMVAYVALLRPLGYVLSSMLVATSIALFYGSRSVVGIGIVGVLAPLGIYYTFTRFLSVSLPPLPWN